MLSDLFLVPHSRITLRPLPEDLTSAEKRVKTTPKAIEALDADAVHEKKEWPYC